MVSLFHHHLQLGRVRDLSDRGLSGRSTITELKEGRKKQDGENDTSPNYLRRICILEPIRMYGSVCTNPVHPRHTLVPKARLSSRTGDKAKQTSLAAIASRRKCKDEPGLAQ